MQLFRSLPEALIFLSNPYWLSIIRKLCPTEPDTNPKRVEELAQQIRKGIEGNNDVVDYSRIAKRAMQKTAVWIHADNRENESINYDTLLSLLPKELRVRDYKGDLERSVQYLRDQTFMRQGFSWNCEVCQHPNWVHLEDIVAILNCEICRVEKSSPVCGDSNVHFKLNPFVATAFSSSSSQGPVAWTLSRLASGASWSFMFTPALDIYKPGVDERYTDVDVLAAVDGEIYMLEVKQSFAGVTDNEVNKLVELASIVRPDFAGFSVQCPRIECSLDAAGLARVTKALSEVDVKFVLWTSDDPNPWVIPVGIPLPHGPTMEWNAW